MAEKLCALLGLNTVAGLGRRLLEAEIRQDSKNANLYYLRSKQHGTEAMTLAYALSLLAKTYQHHPIFFRPERSWRVVDDL
ncbi:MAG TPA: hypothetical protein PKE64_28095 [Anaerolineae bacterium]|nr:hypothetical protein [Anaerolineae bacterium]HMR67890.1 hypothetical protein [Anaerolineae bacterium]